jgi:WD40 repeat protein
MGLASFTSDRAANFFGREKEAEAFANRLRSQSFVAVVGPSGAGKSSFIQAGVVPLLPAGWVVVSTRPGPAPLKALTHALCAGGILEPERAARSWEDPADLARALRQAASASRTTLVIVIDQFEELVTLCLDPAQQNTFASALVQAASGADGAVRIIVTLRDDFLIRVQSLAPLRDRIAQGIQLLSTPAPDELIRILTEPARRAGYAFEDSELAKEMVTAVETLPGALALLSFTASRLWELRDLERRALTRRSYAALGGVGGALAQHAEATLTAISTDAQAAAREAFRHLVTAEGTRAVLTRRQLIELMGSSRGAEETLDALINARLLVSSESASGEDRIEVIHEALLSSWPRLVKWQKEDADNVRMRDQLRAAARQWEQLARGRGALWRGDTLLEYRLWRKRYPGRLTQLEEAFAAASLREETQNRRIRKGLLLASFVILGCGMVTLIRANARTAQRLAEFHFEQGRTSILSNDVLRGLVYLAQAYQEGIKGPAIRYALARSMHEAEGQLNTFTGHTSRIQFARFTPDGSRLVTGSTDHTVRIWQTSDASLLSTFEVKGLLYGTDLSRDGRRIAAVDEKGFIHLWGVDGASVAEIEAHKGMAYAVRFSPDGRLLASVGADSTVRLWNATSGEPVCTGHTTSPQSDARFSPDGRTLITVPGTFYFPGNLPADPRGILWDVPGCRPRLWLAAAQGYMRFTAFAPDGTLVATAGSDNAVNVWQVEKGKQVLHLQGHEGPVEALLFSPDGKRLVTGSDDGSVRVWSLPSGVRERILNGHTGSVTATLFSPDAQTLVTLSSDGTARLWEASSGRLLWVYLAHSEAALTGDFLPQGGALVTAGDDGFARLWRVDQRLEERMMEGHRQDVWMRMSRDRRRIMTMAPGLISVADVGSGQVLKSVKLPLSTRYFDWAPDEKRLVVDDHEKAQLFTYPDLNPLGTFEGHTADLEFVAFSPDARRVLTASDDATAKLWDAESLGLLATFRETSAVSSAQFSPDGRTLALTDVEGDLTLVDGVSGKLLHRWHGHRSSAYPLSFSADGRYIITGSADRFVKVWDARTSAPVAVLGRHDDIIHSAEFSPDGRLAVSGSMDGVVNVWDTETWSLIGRFNSGKGTLFAAFTGSGDHILTGGSPEQDMAVWPAGLTSDPPERVSRFLRCHVPFELRGRQVIPASVDRSACSSLR